MQSVGASMSAHADKSEKRKDKFCSSADSDAMPNPFGFGWVERTFSAAVVAVAITHFFMSLIPNYE